MDLIETYEYKRFLMKLFSDAIVILLQNPEDENALTAAVMLLKWYRLTQPVQPQVAEELREIEEEVSCGIKSNSYVWGNWSENAEKVSYLFSKQNMYEQGITTTKGL